MLSELELDHPGGQEPQRPSWAPIGRRATGFGNEMRLCFTGEKFRWSTAPPFAKCYFDSFLHTPLSDSMHRGNPDIKALGYLLITQALIRLEQHAGTRESARSRATAARQPQQFCAFVVGEVDNIFDIRLDRFRAGPCNPRRKKMPRMYCIRDASAYRIIGDCRLVLKFKVR